FSASLSPQNTSYPTCARQAAVVRPTYPAPITDIFIELKTLLGALGRQTCGGYVELEREGSRTKPRSPEFESSTRCSQPQLRSQYLSPTVAAIDNTRRTQAR